MSGEYEYVPWNKRYFENPEKLYEDYKTPLNVILCVELLATIFFMVEWCMRGFDNLHHQRIQEALMAQMSSRQLAESEFRESGFYGAGASRVEETVFRNDGAARNSQES